MKIVLGEPPELVKSHAGGDICFTSGLGWIEPGGKKWPDGVIKFLIGSEANEILRLDSEGMTYKGQHINDAGEAHKAFLKFLNDNFRPPE